MKQDGKLCYNRQKEIKARELVIELKNHEKKGYIGK